MALTALLTALASSQPDDTPAGAVRALHHLSWASWAIASVGLVVLLVAATFLILRTAVLPSWLGWVALVGGLAQFLLLFLVLEPDNEKFVLGYAWLPASLALIRAPSRTALGPRRASAIATRASKVVAHRPAA